MKVKYVIILLLLPLMLCAQGHGLQVALRGGAGQCKSSEGAGTWTPDGGLDLNYVVHWRVATYTRLGLHTGLGATYSTYLLKGDYTSFFTRQDYLGNTIEYTTYAHAEEQHQSVGVTLPVLFALQARGFALNIGPKVLWMAYDHYQQTIDKADILAYFPAYKVYVPNQPGTGMLNTPYSHSGHNSLLSLHLLASLEIGYEWQLGDIYNRYKEQYFGVQLYANYGVWNWTNRSNEPFLSVSSITTTMQSPQVNTQSMPSSASALANLSVGVRLYYTIQTVDYPGRGWHRYTGKRSTLVRN